jgi:hypothetical protein
MRLTTPRGVKVEGDGWGRRAPLWVERHGDPARHLLYCQSGRVARGAPVYVTVTKEAHQASATLFLTPLRKRYRLCVVWERELDWQI